jgi:hypothetical protein
MNKLFISLLLATILAACTTSTGITPLPAATQADPDETLPIIEMQASAVQTLPNTQTRPNVLAFNRQRIEAVVLEVNRSSGAISFDKNTLTAEELAKIVAGNVIVGHAGKRTKRGVLRKITGVVDQGSVLLVQTTKASLADVFSDGGFRVKDKARLRNATHLILPDGTTQRLRPAGLSSQGLIFPVVINYCPINLDGNKSTASDQVCVTGSLDLDLSFDLTFQCKGVLCSKPYLDTHVTFTETAKLTVEGELSKSVDKTIPLGTVPLGSFAVPVAGIPVVFVAEVDLSITLSGEVSANLKYTANQTAAFTAGVELNDGKFAAYTDFDNNVDSSSVEVSLDMSAKATLTGEASVLVYGLGGPTVTLEGWVKLEAGFPRSPTWDLTAGLDLLLGVELDVFGLVNLDWNKKVMSLDWDIAQAANSKPTVVLKNPVDGETVRLLEQTISGGVKLWKLDDMDANTDDTEDGVNCCTVNWYAEDLLKAITKPGSGHKTSIAFGSTGPHTIKLEAIDSSGGNTTKSYTITIESCQTATVGGQTVCIEPSGANNPFNSHI